MKNIIIVASLLSAIVIGVVACTTDPLYPDGYLENLAQIGTSTDTTTTNDCPPGAIIFNKEILPIISSNCAFSGCHDAITRAEGVVLDTYDNIIKEVRASQPNNSKLYESITKTGGDDDVMPPPPYSKLSTDQILLIKNWINQGALNLVCGGCDTTTVTFTSTVYPIIQNQCMTCHNDSRQDGGVNLANYSLIKQVGGNGALMGSIQHDPNYKAMPPSGVQIDQCFIDQIQIWINDGMPNN